MEKCLSRPTNVSYFGDRAVVEPRNMPIRTTFE